jgi:hypothetical protein
VSYVRIEPIIILSLFRSFVTVHPFCRHSADMCHPLHALGIQMSVTWQAPHPMAARGEYTNLESIACGDLSETDMRAWIIRRLEAERLNSPSHPVPLQFQDVYQP